MSRIEEETKQAESKKEIRQLKQVLKAMWVSHSACKCLHANIICYRCTLF